MLRQTVKAEEKAIVIGLQVRESGFDHRLDVERVLIKGLEDSQRGVRRGASL
jgi:hypothetical protein